MAKSLDAILSITRFSDTLESADSLKKHTDRCRSDPDYAAKVDAESEWFGHVPPWGDDVPINPSESFKTALAAGRIKITPVRQIASGPLHRVVRTPGMLPPE